MLNEQGWNVIVVWECQLKKATTDDTLQYLVGQIKSSAPTTVTRRK